MRKIFAYLFLIVLLTSCIANTKMSLSSSYKDEFILNKSNVEIEFLRKGTKFIHPETGEEMGVYKNALCLVYFYPVEV